MKKNNLLNLIVLLGLLVSMVSCGNQEKNLNHFQIEGEIINNASEVIYLDKIYGNRFEPEDTTTVSSEGAFVFEGEAKEAGIYRLRVDKKHMWLLVVGDKKMTASLNYDDVENYKVEGDQRFNHLMNLVSLYRTNYQKMGALEKEVTANGQPDEKGMAYYQEQAAILKKALQNNIKAFIDTNKSEVSLFAVYSLDMESELGFVESQLPKFEKLFPGNMEVASLKNEVESYKSIQIGTKATDLNYKDPNGNTIRLSSLEGQVVLLDFWASWCGPCRKTNPELVDIYNDYQNKGFTVYSVSLDKKRDAWLNAISQDQLAWKNHVSDLKGWQAEGAQLYKVRSIPSTFLLDKNGVIVARNLHGDDLRSKIEEIL